MSHQQHHSGYRGRGRGRGRGGGRGGGDRKPKDESKLLAKMKPETIDMFRAIQSELDHKHDKHERMVKLSRDLTIESKRIIFLLHRVTTAADKQELIADAEQKLQKVRDDLCYPLSRELRDEDCHQFIRAYGFGMQEYIEACTLLNFIKQKEHYDLELARSVLNFVDASEQQDNDDEAEGEETCDQADNADKNSEKQVADKDSDKQVVVPLLLSDYLLGLADASGELMRLSINSVSAQDFDTPLLVLRYLQILHENFAVLGVHYSRDASSKLRLVKQCMEKVERAMYILKLRRTEIPDSLLADVLVDDPPDPNQHDDM